MSYLAGPACLWVQRCPECAKVYLESILRLIPEHVCERCILAAELEASEAMTAGRWVALTGRISSWHAAQLVFRKLANQWGYYHIDRYVGGQLTPREKAKRLRADARPLPGHGQPVGGYADDDGDIF